MAGGTWALRAIPAGTLFQPRAMPPGAKGTWPRPHPIAVALVIPWIRPAASNARGRRESGIEMQSKGAGLSGLAPLVEAAGGESTA